MARRKVRARAEPARAEVGCHARESRAIHAERRGGHARGFAAQHRITSDPECARDRRERTRECVGKFSHGKKKMGLD